MKDTDQLTMQCPNCGKDITSIDTAEYHNKICGVTINFENSTATNIRDALSDYAHTAWSGWIKYQFGKCELDAEGNMIVPKELVDRWVRQSTTDYKDLPTSEKISDGDEADKMLDIICQYKSEANDSNTL